MRLAAERIGVAGLWARRCPPRRRPHPDATRGAAAGACRRPPTAPLAAPRASARTLLQMKLGRSVPSSTTTVPPPVKRRMTGTPRARAASTLTSFSTTPLMPMTIAGAGSPRLKTALHAGVAGGRAARRWAGRPSCESHGGAAELRAAELRARDRLVRARPRCCCCPGGSVPGGALAHQLPACERRSASSSCSCSKMCVPTRRSTLSTGRRGAMRPAPGRYACDVPKKWERGGWTEPRTWSRTATRAQHHRV